jgi:hypothetical protein
LELLYDPGLEVDYTFLLEIDPALECLLTQYPPPIPKNSFRLPKFDLPSKCQKVHLLLYVMAAHFTSHPMTVTAVCVVIPQTPLDIVNLLGISSNNMATVYMSPYPYFDAFVESTYVRLISLNIAWQDLNFLSGMASDLFKMAWTLVSLTQ